MRFGVPCGQLGSYLVGESAEDLFPVDPVLGEIRVPGTPLRLTSHRSEASRPAPQLGEHNREIFGGRLGLSDYQIETLKTAGTI